MDVEKNRELGKLISKLTAKHNLSREEAYQGFRMILANEVTDMQQGAFLAALTTKGETAAEVAAGWQAVYDLDTNKVDLDGLDVVDNCGTGMDSFKTFNISTAASLVAAEGGVVVARHGARAITSSCGTVDMAELLGADVECSAELVAKSIKQAGIGLFNGMSPEIHPLALGRILSQICFGSPLNIAASLAHPALPKRAVRGVYSQELLYPVAEVMQAIGYSDAVVVYGAIDGSDKGFDEASVCGQTKGLHLKDGTITEFTLRPEQFGMTVHTPEEIAAVNDIDEAAQHMYWLLAGEGQVAQCDVVILNSALIFYVQEVVATIEAGVQKAREILMSGGALNALERWVEVQNNDPAAGLAKLNKLSEKKITDDRAAYS